MLLNRASVLLKGVFLLLNLFCRTWCFVGQQRRVNSLASRIIVCSTATWLNLAEECQGVQKQKEPILVTSADSSSPAATTTRPKPGDRIEINYVGTIAETVWTPQEVVDCWLREHQGTEDLVEPFLSHNIDGTKLLCLNEDYFREELKVSNKIKCKKLAMAVKRLQQIQKEFPVGTEFDSSLARNKPFSFVLGQRKVIRGMELAVASMHVGEKALFKFRSDYAYGSEGLRKANGDVMVPPFATLLFQLELLSAGTTPAES